VAEFWVQNKLLGEGAAAISKFRLKNVNTAFLFGFVSGVFGGAYNTSGPPVVLYGTLRKWDSEQFRATIQLYSLCTNIFAIAGYYIAGALTRDIVAYYGWSLPVVAVTVWLGGKIHRATPSEKYVVYVKILLRCWRRGFCMRRWHKESRKRCLFTISGRKSMISSLAMR